MRNYIFILLLGLFSCTNNSQRREVEAISELPSCKLVFQEIPIEPLLSRPYQMEIIDSILILADDVENRALLLYNLADSSFVRALLIGQGPHDVLSPIAIDVDMDGKIVNVLQRQNGKCRKYALNDLLNNCAQDYNSVDLGAADRFARINNGYACLGFYEDAMLTFFDENGSPQSHLDLCTGYGISDIVTKYKLFQGRIAYHKKSGNLMLAPSFASVIRFFHNNSGMWTQVDSFCIGKKKLEDRILNENNPDLHDSDVQCCIDICKSDNYFYMLYSGDDLRHSLCPKSRYIVRFDILGCLDCIYEVNPTMCNICVSRDDKTVYAVMIGENGEYVLAKSFI